MENVLEGTVEVGYTIREIEMQYGPLKYDWVLSGGEGSDVWFESAEAAFDAMLRHVRG